MIDLFEDAKQGQPQAVQEVREMNAKVWTQVEVDAVNIIRRLVERHEVFNDRKPIDLKVFVPRHFMSKEEPAQCLWIRPLGNKLYLAKLQLHDGIMKYWVLRTKAKGNPKPIADVTEWLPVQED